MQARLDQGPQHGIDIDTVQNMRITTRNVHGIMSNLMATLRSGTDIICVQEADVAEANVADLTEQALAAGTLPFGVSPPLCPRTGCQCEDAEQQYSSKAT